MTSFESLPIFSKELAVVPAVYTTITTTTTKTISSTHQQQDEASPSSSSRQLITRKPLSLAQLSLVSNSSSSRENQRVKPPIWTQNPVISQVLLPFALPSPQEELEQEKKRKIHEMNLRNKLAMTTTTSGVNHDCDQSDSIDWKEENFSGAGGGAALVVAPGSLVGNNLDGTRRRSPVHSVHDDLKRVSDQTQVNYGRRRNSLLQSTQDRTSPDFHHGKPRAAIHAHSEADREWGFQVAELIERQKPKNQFQLAPSSSTQHAIHAATARPLPVCLIREAVAHLNRAEYEASLTSSAAVAPSARTVGGSPIRKNEKLDLFVDRDLVCSDTGDNKKENTTSSVTALIVKGDPLEGLNPDVLPVTKRHRRTVDEITETSSFRKGSTQKTLNKTNEGLKRLQVQTIDPTAVFSDLFHHDSSRHFSPRNENVAARNSQIFLVQPNMRQEPPLLSSRVSAPPRKIVEASLCVSKETCGPKQNFLYKLGDV